MNLFNECRLKFDRVDWRRDQELALVDTIIEKHPEIIEIAAEDITNGVSRSQFGRKDTPSVEQIVRAAIFKELKGLDYRSLEYAQEDSRVCGAFVKLNQRKPFKFQTLQRYIAKISEESLSRVLQYLNQIAIDEGIESLQKIRMDSSDVETNIHYPTNNSLIWDCIRKSCEFLEQLQEQTNDLKFRDYRKSAKRNYYKINNIKSKDKREKLFQKQLTTFTKCINQVDQVIRNPKKKALT